MKDFNHLQNYAKRLGYAGLLPPMLCLVAVSINPTLRWIIIAAGFGYSALLFSFLGGIWWGIAIANRNPPSWLWFVAIAPPIIGLTLFMPWTFGWEWPSPALKILGLLIAASPLIDLAVGKSIDLPSGWLKLRFHLSSCLAVLTIALSQLSP